MFRLWGKSRSPIGGCNAGKIQYSGFALAARSNASGRFLGAALKVRPSRHDAASYKTSDRSEWEVCFSLLAETGGR
jgi:hypothetical protein